MFLPESGPDGGYAGSQGSLHDVRLGIPRRLSSFTRLSGARTVSSRTLRSFPVRLSLPILLSGCIDLPRL